MSKINCLEAFKGFHLAPGFIEFQFFPSFVQICQIEKEENQRNAVERTNMNMKSAKKEKNSQLEYFRKFKVTVLASLDISSSKFFEEKLKTE